MLKIKVGRIVRRLGLKTPFKSGIPGKDWMTAFIKRHPEISLRSPTALSTVRAKMLNATVTNNYFDALTDLLQSLDLTDKPHRIWNIDETSVPLAHKPSKVLGPTGVKNIPGRVGNCRDNVSVLACINAAGGEVPPMFIVKGKTYKSLYAYNTTEGVPGGIYTYQEKAWMEDVLGEQWFQNHFLKYCGEERPQLIILDSHSSHETLGLIDSCRQNNISLLALPPHTTQWLCPLDKTVFGPLSREYSAVCSDFMASSPNNMVSKWELPRLFQLAHQKAFTPTNIQSGFRKCGIYPLDRNALPPTAVAPSQPFEKGESVSSLHGQESSSSATLPVADGLMLSSTSTVPSEEGLVLSSAAAVPPDEGLMMSSSATVPAEEALMLTTSATVLTEQELIESVLGGSVPFTLDAEGIINIQLPVSVSPERIPSASEWMAQVDNVFTLPVADRPPKVSSKKITSHRLLTSTEIFDKKLKEKVQKEQQIKMKEERKIARKIKQDMKQDIKKDIKQM